MTENNTVHYNPLNPTPPTPSHDYVEIGGVKWATMNVGANSITDTGLYFQWGDTQGYTAAQVGNGEGKKEFAWSDYKYTNDGGSTFTKYNCSSSSGSGSGSAIERDNLCELQLSDDAVNASWGGNWRMPTNAEFQALGTATTSAWTADYEGSGVAGLVLTSTVDSSKKLFFPAVGYCYDGSVDLVGDSGFYWSSSLYSGGVKYPCSLNFHRLSVNWDYSGRGRCYGYPVRGVLGENS